MGKKKDKTVNLIEGNWCIRVMYRGTAYNGWQSQGERNENTVQATVENTLREIFNNPQLNLQGSGRTDSGVHSLGMPASFHVAYHKSWTGEKLLKVLNRRMPSDIMIKSAEIWPDDLHARFSSHGKTYVYVLNNSGKRYPFSEDLYYSSDYKYDFDKMSEAARELIGTHDFTAFAAKKKLMPRKEIAEGVLPAKKQYRTPPKPEGNVRTIYDIRLTEHKGFIFMSFTGSGFLYKMVRSLVGHLLWVGNGKCTVEDTRRLLEGKVRTNLVETAPARGLYMAKVFYEPEEWKSYNFFKDESFPLHHMFNID